MGESVTGDELLVLLVPDDGADLKETEIQSVKNEPDLPAKYRTSF